MRSAFWLSFAAQRPWEIKEPREPINLVGDAKLLGPSVGLECLPFKPLPVSCGAFDPLLIVFDAYLIVFRIIVAAAGAEQHDGYRGNDSLDASLLYLLSNVRSQEMLLGLGPGRSVQEILIDQ